MHPEYSRLFQRHPPLADCADALLAAHGLLHDCFKGGHRLLLCGNGGSSSDAEHWAGELLKGFYSKRPLSAEQLARFPDATGERLQDALPAIPLSGFTALRSAVANDMAGELDYAQLVWALGRPGDVLVGISTSGNARNVNLAASAAKARGMKVISLTGSGGGELARAADVAIRVPAGRTHEVQEYHLAVYHAICLALEDEFFGQR
jgi:D-sedoheptulose 7-phosphate isomerase